jgi:hypothetical protein
MLSTLTVQTHFSYLLIAALVLFLPGLAWQVWARAGGRDPLERLADSAGISIALTALAGLAGFLLHLRFNGLGVVGLYGVCLFIWLAGLFRPGYLRLNHWRMGALGLAGAALLLGAAAWRLYQARVLLLPAWVDSVHHVLVVKLIEQAGGVPKNFLPYFPVDFTYHFGFHLLAAVFSSLARVPAEQGVLWFGQVVNALVALSVYRLGKAAWRDWRAAALSAVLVAFVFQMPAYYLSWGRYTLLTGLVVLPLAMAAALERSRAEGNRELSARLAVLTAGVALSHFTTLALLLAFLIFLGLGLVLRRAWQPLRATALASLVGGVLALPWLWRSWTALSYQAGLEVVSPLSSDQSGYGKYLLSLIGPNYNYWLYGLALAALVWLLLRGPARAFSFWALGMGVLMLPWGLRVSPFRPDHMAILIFLPSSLLLGEALTRLVDGLAGGRLPERLRFLGRGLSQAGKWALPLVALGLLAWGLSHTRNVTNPSTNFVNAADMQAIRWIENNTPADARFFINSTGWQGQYRGVDGGYWLLTLTNRQTVTLPALAWMGDKDYQAELNHASGLASQATGCDDFFWQAVDETGLNYVYLKEGVGALQPEELTKCPGVVNVYRRDGVFIFAIER